ncbi:putative putative dual-specificity protein phosphatase [Leishmania infantum JPCM5]|uniref:Putative_dual-specificity_protein_phosphatase_-_putative n=2 Tax=Leishmania infantum TaxID=5671 RepID=A0A6L0XSQ1_LEIIN|nr:putative putative dual-specificity protein phosphatase [Leishmania infantum JPCM5]CAC9502421.1 putative_dual-specificity_protein_phosphatase_-_putative [Leishmania infantum]CAM69308.1 putative putative dual-specificity protein phosphatase [Leishmania infantum JPCM5]SUZ43245.1 putative_dual-specificity_protein_phosphatase_-_putative [Leishmania infantum]|eukprot:XP_001470116.1 putative putative dual-specificity protein phosphatase [Leishmania infantum JPCM5]
MESILASLQWESETLPLPGSHSTVPDDDFPPWKCISEVIPGLYLTCASEMADKTKCAAMGVALVINMCGEDDVTKYRVFERDESAAYAFRRLDSQESFVCELSSYCRIAVNTPKAQRKVFVVTIPAEDTPTYSIDQHFVECAVLMEIVLRSRKGYETVSDEDYTTVPAVAVHCMVGVSRSASVVVAYLIKKYGLSQDDAISLIRCTRPVVQPNPGFQRQLSMWMALRSHRIVDEWTAKVLAVEVKTKSNLVELASTMLPTILRAKKCENERRYFGSLIKNASPTEAELHAVYRELRSVVAADVDSEVYTDIPNYFGYVAEVVCSIDCAAPAVLQYATDFRNSLVCNDAFYYRVVKDVARSGFEKDTFDTIRGFCSLFEAIYVKHLCARDCGRPAALNPSAGDTGLPSACALSFPFLFLVAPYAEGFVQFSEWNALVNEFATTGDALSTTELRRLKNETVRMFLQFFFQSSRTAEGSAATESYTKLGFLQNDVEVVTFRAVKSDLKTGGGFIASLESIVAVSQSVDDHVAFLLLCKMLSGVLAFRLLLEAAEQFLCQTYGERLGESVPLAEELLPLHVISSAALSLESAYTAVHCKPCKAGDFFRGELSSLLETGVLNPAGVVSLFQATL